jgi:PhoH-like ATPase
MVNKKTKLFVLDTNVLLHDPSCLYRFEEHDIYLPMVTLEELDNIKKGGSEVARNARQTSRFIEEIIADTETNLDQGCILDKFSKNSGRLFLKTKPIYYLLAMLSGS